MKKENGFTGVDIAISVVVITIFIALIGTLVFNFNSNSNEIEYQSKALDYAINEIERIKALEINDVTSQVETEILDNEDNATGYYEKIEVIDIGDPEDEISYDIMSDEDLNGRERIAGLVKKATVTISYNYRNQTKSVQLSTILTKNF